MKAVRIVLIYLQIIILTLLTACAGKTKPYIPNQIEPLANGMARIILTRDGQFAGSRNPFEVVDIGNSIEPNSMMAFLQTSSLYIKLATSAESALLPKNIGWANVELLWTNPYLLPTVSCGNARHSCGSLLKDQLIYQDGFLRGDVGLMESNDHYAMQLTGHVLCGDKPDDLYVKKERLVPNQPILSINPPTTIEPDITLMEKVRLQKYETIAFPVTNVQPLPNKATFLEGIRIPDSKLPLVFHTRYLSCDRFKKRPPVSPSTLLKSMPVAQHCISNQTIERNVQLIGRVFSGDTLIWDRKPGTLRLGAIWHSGVDFMQKEIKIEPGKQYYIHYTVNLTSSDEWELKKVE